MGRLMTAADIERAERAYGLAYFRSADGRALFPATHVSESGLIGFVDRRARWLGYHWIVSWSVRDAAGDMLVYGYEMAFGDSPGIRAMRRAVDALHTYGCVHRVRPGDHGPWGAAP